MYNINQNMIHIEKSEYIYHVFHRIMEGDCQYDHGPKMVEVGGFSVDRYPVTNKQFKDFLDSSGYNPEDDTNFLKHWKGKYSSELADYPVVWVSLNDAKEYSKWRGCRLLKDYEWQYIASGDQNLKWPWGEKYANSYCNNSSHLAKVNSFPEGKSVFSGCYDLCANAWEMVGDIIDDGHHLFTFLRGGCFYRASHYWHTLGGPQPNNYHLKMQLLNEAINRNETVSFRCVKDDVL